MTVSYAAAVKALRMTATRDAVANGSLELLSAGDVVLAIFGLSADAGDVVDDVWTLEFDSATVQGEAGASGGVDATKAQIKTSGGTAVITGLTVGTAASDIILDSNNIDSGQDVTLTAATITHA
jgi:hypothetical protein